jgi:hypothetical protein
MNRAPLYLLALLPLLGCGETPGPEQVARSTAPIINGQLDTSHQAVVAYLKGSKCTATIVHVDVGTGNGYALTAAHCIGGQLGNLRQGDNHANGQFDVEYPVVETEIHPEYASSGLYDFAMLRFSGATAQTPVIAAMSPAEDALNEGKQVELVGYGQTESGATTQRHTIMRPIDSLSSLRMRFDQATGGICSGDSGGAVLDLVGGQLRVAGVHSSVESNVMPVCSGSGNSVRVSAVYDTFIMPFINGTAYQPQTCSQCSDASFYNDAGCFTQLENCGNDSACSAYLDCLGSCSKQSCVVQCDLDHAAGKPLYDLMVDCLCNTACSSECMSSTTCNPAACGFRSGIPSCQSCLDANCCAEASSCATDPMCTECYSGALVAGCGADPATQAMKTCLGTHCSSECNVAPPPTSGAGGSAGGAGGASTSVGVGGADPSTVSSAASGGGEPVVVEDGGCAVVAPRRAGRRAAWLLTLASLGLVSRRRRRTVHSRRRSG